MQVLVVEHDVNKSRDIEEILESLGYEVLTVHHGDEAWAILQDEGSPKIVILGQVGQGIKTLDLSRNRRTVREHTDLQYFILLTDKEDLEGRCACLESEVDDCLYRPFEPEELKTRLIVAERFLRAQSHRPTASENRLKHNDEWFGCIIRHTPSAIAVYDKAMRYLLVNDRYLQDYSVREEDLIGRCLYDVFPRMPERWKKVHERVLAGAIERADEDHIIRRNGSIHFMRWECRPWRDAEGHVGGLVTYSENITERKRAEKALQEQMRFLQVLIDAIPVPVFYKAATGAYLGCNAEFEKSFGVEKEEIIGKMKRDLFPDKAAELAEAVDAELLRTHGSKTYEAELTYADGTQHQVLVSKAVFTRSDGSLGGLVGIILDITDRKRAEEERRKIEHQILHVQKLEGLGVLAGGIAHEFNNLLMGILGYADLALMDLPSLSKSRTSIQQIKDLAHSAADLTRQMLAYSGKGKLDIEVINLSEVIREMSDLLEVSISKKSILKYQLSDNLPCIEADLSQIHQIVMNLVVNALEALGDGGGVVTVRTGMVEADRTYLAQTYLNDGLPEGCYVALEVSDTGSGMDADLQARIFDPFFSTKFTGRGLGLAAVMGIVRRHRGAVKVYSEPGQGSTFRVLFPCMPGSDVVCSPDAEDAEPWKGSGTVLVVDDEESVRTVTKLSLERFGFTVLTARDGQEAMELFRRHAHEIALVLLDMTMPYMNGSEVFQEMRRLRPDVAIMLSSGYNEQEIVERFTGKGISGFLQKPYSLNDLLKKIRAVL